MKGMRTKGTELDTNFGDLGIADEQSHIARLQKNPLDKQATYFDQYNVRVTCESKAGNTDVNFSPIINALSDAGVNYREEKRYTVQPDRVILNVLVHKEDLEAVKKMNDQYKEQQMTFTVNDNPPEDVVPKVIVTPEKELDEKITEKGVK